jgi:integrase
MGLADAKGQAAIVRSDIRKNIDPLAEKKRPSDVNCKTVDDVAQSWLIKCEKRLKYPSIPQRVYTKDIRPLIGALAIDRVNAQDIYALITNINDSGRPTIANDALGYCKQLFNHAAKLGLIQINPAKALDTSDAGGKEESRDRNLSIEEIKIVFECFRNNHNQFARDNYLACVLLLCLGARKSELVAAPWKEFDLANGLWNLPAERSKTGVAITYPLNSLIIECLHELKVRAFGSKFVFPNRRASKRFDHMSPDTLNAAVNKLFVQKKLEIEHFTIHDLRRTFRTLLSKLGVSPYIGERCLNHKPPKIQGVYDKHDYFNERMEAHQKLVDQIRPFIWPEIV